MYQVAEALIGTIRRKAPQLLQTVAWGHVCFVGRERIASVIPHKTHVNLQLWRGAEFEGFDAQLEGTGKAMRHFKVRTPEEAGSETVRRLIGHAVKLDEAAC